MGGFVPPPYGRGQVQGGQSVNGGLMRGTSTLWGDLTLIDYIMGGLMRRDIDLMGGPNFDRLYHKLKVLLLLSCNYTMQFVGYDSIKPR